MVNNKAKIDDMELRTNQSTMYNATWIQVD